MSEENKERALAMGVSHGIMQPTNVGEALELAKMVAHSGMVPKAYEGKPGAVLVALQMGAEVGLQPMQAIQNIAVINGRPSLWGDAVLAIVRNHPHCESVDEWFDAEGTAHCRIKRRGMNATERTFSPDDARTAGLWGKSGPWTQYPKRMLQMRARGFAARDSFPDALRGLSLAEETRDVIEMEPEFVPPDASPMAPGKHSLDDDAPTNFEARNNDFLEKAIEAFAYCGTVGKVKSHLRRCEKAIWPRGGIERITAAARARIDALEPPAEVEESQPETPAKPPKKVELTEGEAELLGMVSRAETMAELDVLIKEAGKRRLRKEAKGIILARIAERRAELQRAGKPEPGADG